MILLDKGLTSSPTFQIVWSAAVKGGVAYPEADLPGQEGKYCIMIGVSSAKFNGVRLDP
jgi:hypothetical protein